MPANKTGREAVDFDEIWYLLWRELMVEFKNINPHIIDHDWNIQILDLPKNFI